MLILNEEEEDEEEDDMNLYNAEPSSSIDKHIVHAVNAFFKSIAIYNNNINTLQSGMSEATKLQDILRLLHLWFNHGHKSFVSKALLNGFNSVLVDTWLDVIPQIIARLQTA